MRPIDTQDKRFHDGDGISELGTIVPAWWLNQIQSELLAIMSDAGINPDEADNDQVSIALNKMLDNKANKATTVSGYGITDAVTTAQVSQLLTGTSTTNVASEAALASVNKKFDDIVDASLAAKGVVKLSNAINSDSETEAATSKAVKDAYDLAVSKTAGIGQKWRNISSTIKPSTTYINTTNRALFISAYSYQSVTTSKSFDFFVDGLRVGRFDTTSYDDATVFMLIPPESSYYFEMTGLTLNSSLLIQELA